MVDNFLGFHNDDGPNNEGSWLLSRIENAPSCRYQEEMNNSTEGTHKFNYSYAQFACGKKVVGNLILDPTWEAMVQLVYILSNN